MSSNGRRPTKKRRTLAGELIRSLFFKGNLDIEFIVLILLMLLFGLIMVTSASSVNALYRLGGSMVIARKQLICAAIGFILMMVISRVDYHIITHPNILMPFLVATWILMMITAFFGEEYNGARRWIFGFQPSELAKIGWVLFFAKVCAEQSAQQLNSFKESWLKYAVMIGVIAAPLLIQPHKSAMILIGLVCLTIVIVAGANLKYFAAVTPLAVVVVGIVLMASEYSRERIISAIDPFKDIRGTGWQAVQSLYAIGSGGFFGKGLGKSVQKQLYIPEPQNDFIFSIICEELGLLGALLVLLLFFMLIIRCVKIGMEAPDKLGCLISVGMGALIFMQMAINIAVVTASIPVTGMPLPFFSAGGTSLLFTVAGMGVVLNVSRQSRQRKMPSNKK